MGFPLSRRLTNSSSPPSSRNIIGYSPTPSSGFLRSLKPLPTSQQSIAVSPSSPPDSSTAVLPSSFMVASIKRSTRTIASSVSEKVPFASLSKLWTVSYLPPLTTGSSRCARSPNMLFPPLNLISLFLLSRKNDISPQCLILGSCVVSMDRRCRLWAAIAAFKSSRHKG